MVVSPVFQELIDGHLRSLSRRVLLSVSSVAETWRTSRERPLCLLMTPEHAPAAHCFDAGALPALISAEVSAPLAMAASIHRATA